MNDRDRLTVTVRKNPDGTFLSGRVTLRTDDRTSTSIVVRDWDQWCNLMDAADAAELGDE